MCKGSAATRANGFSEPKDVTDVMQVVSLIPCVSCLDGEKTRIKTTDHRRADTEQQNTSAMPGVYYCINYADKYLLFRTLILVLWAKLQKYQTEASQYNYFHRQGYETIKKTGMCVT